MANLIKAYYTKKEIPKHIEFIPGDIIVFGKIENVIFVGEYLVEKLYIVDLNRDPRFITKKCPICNKFHINQTQFTNFLGKHWKKYKYKFFDLGLPITGKECN